MQDFNFGFNLQILKSFEMLIDIITSNLTKWKMTYL